MALIIPGPFNISSELQVGENREINVIIKLRMSETRFSLHKDMHAS